MDPYSSSSTLSTQLDDAAALYPFDPNLVASPWESSDDGFGAYPFSDADQMAALGVDYSIPSFGDSAFSSYQDPSFLGQDFSRLDGLHTPGLMLDDAMLLDTERYLPRTELTPDSDASGPITSSDWVPEDIEQMGYQDGDGSWRCRYAGCQSRKTFERACDLRKHFRSHQRTYFCDEKECQAMNKGFSSWKDCQRHMRSHKPTIQCPFDGCDRMFSRQDNMREHYKKIHESARNNLFPRPCRRRNGAAK